MNAVNGAKDVTEHLVATYDLEKAKKTSTINESLTDFE